MDLLLLTDRSVQVHDPNDITSPKKLECGAHQGSLVSPLLFLLYLAEPMSGTNSRTRFSYANDMKILGIGRALTDSAAAVQREVNILLDWARENAVSFDLTKTKVVQFPGSGQETSIGLTRNGIRFEPAEHTR